jgi:ribosome maturation factor RimP
VGGASFHGLCAPSAPPHDCEKVSRRISALLDVEDPVPGHYELEVSSPGFDRPLRTLEHFQRYLGAQVKVETLRPLDGRRRFKGTLLAADADRVRVEVDGAERDIPFGLIARASLVPDA